MTRNNRIPLQGFELDEFHRNVSDEELLADLSRVASALGKPSLTFRVYIAAGKYSSSTIAMRFGTWHAALHRAGLQKTVNRNISKEELFGNIVEVWTKLGRQPRFRDLTSDFSAYSSATYANRFGGWRNALKEFVLWSREIDILVGINDLNSPSRRTPRSPSWRLRAQVLMRDGATCRMCGANPQTGAKLHVDHIDPWSNGGATTLANLQILCEVCNIGKGDLAR